MIDPRTPEGRLTLKYRGYSTEALLLTLGLPTLSSGRDYISKSDLIQMVVDKKLSETPRSNTTTC